MGVKVTMQDYKAFFAKVVNAETADKVEALVKKHQLEVMISFFGVQFKKGGKLIAGCSLNTNTSNLMKGTTPYEQKLIAVELIMTCIEAAKQACEGKSAPKMVKSEVQKTKLGELLKEQLGQSEVEVSLPGGPFKHKNDFKVKVPPTSSVIPLKDAKALMQPVRGTSATSKYYAVALSDKVKVAYRLANHTLSVRVEGELPNVTKTRLSGIGFTNNGEYMSIHMEIGAVEVGQVLGGLLMRMGVSFDETVTNYQELK